jgi:hypothetical protein
MVSPVADPLPVEGEAPREAVEVHAARALEINRWMSHCLLLPSDR